MSQFPAIGSSINSDTVITLTAMDDAGNFSTCNFNFTLLDSINPQFSCLNNQIANVDNNCSYTLPNYLDSIVFSDNCDTSLTLLQTPISGAVVSSDTVITVTATDASGNFSSCTFDLFLLDNTPPTISCPNNAIIDNDISVCGAIYNYITPVGIDNCISNTTLISGLASGSNFPVGLTTNIFQVTDTAGNTASCNFYVLVNDVELPVIDCPSDTSLPFDEACKLIVPDFIPFLGASDNCGIEFINQTPSQLDTVYSDFTTTFLVIDSSGNSQSCNFITNLYDSYVSDLVCPDDQPIQLNENCVLPLPDFSNELQVGALCIGSKIIQQQPPVDSILDFIGEQQITFNVTDTLGNVETCSFNLTITNNEITNCYKIYVPTVFSPDGDGINDRLTAFGLDLDGLEIEIFNRWGQMVYNNSVSQMSWDGTFLNMDSPNGTYVYRIYDHTGKDRQNGTISIVR